MGTFSRVKKYSKPSLEIDEKIKSLDRDLKKTLGEAIANSTSGLYSIVQYVEPIEAIPPTNEDVPDTSGITGDDFVQPTGGGDENDSDTWDSGWQDTSYLYNSDELAGETNRSIIKSVPDPPAGDAPVAGGGIVITNAFFGTSVGYIANGNVYKQVLVGGLTGGTDQPTEDSRGFGGIYRSLTDEEFAYAVAFWDSYQSTKTTRTVSIKAWRRYNRFHDYQRGGEFETWTGGPKKTTSDGDFILDTFGVFVEPNQYESDPGSPYQHGYTTLISRNSLDDSDYYPGPVMNRDGDSTRIAGGNPDVLWNNYNYMNKTYGQPAAEWYLNNPTKPHTSNPYIPESEAKWIPFKGAMLDKFNMSPEATNVLISQVVYGGAAELRRRELEKIKQQMNLPAGVGWQGKYDQRGREYDTTTGKLKGV